MDLRSYLPLLTGDTRAALRQQLQQRAEQAAQQAAQQQQQSSSKEQLKLLRRQMAARQVGTLLVGLFSIVCSTCW
jgi:Tfp pilus assembly protein PilO